MPTQHHSTSGSTGSGGGLAGGGDRAGAGAGAAAEAGGLMSALIATASERPTPGRTAQAASLRRNTVAALGELLFYVITQEPPTAPVLDHHGGNGNGVGVGEGAERCDAEVWSIPAAAVGGVIGRCLLTAAADSGAAGPGVQYYAAKTLENVLAQVGPLHPLVSVLVTPELALGLLGLAR